MNNTNQKRWLLAAGLLAGFLACFFLDLTGAALHQLIGAAGAAAAAVHLLAHWKWVGSVFSRFFGKTSTQARMYFVVDALLLGGFLTILVTGLAISTWFNLALSNYTGWHNLHVVASIWTLLAVVLKVGIHARWIVLVARKMFSAPVPAVPSAVSPVYTRRDFLKVMGTVGAASLLAIGSAAPSLEVAQTGEVESSTSSTVPNLFASSGNSTSECSVRCGKRCSYPGRCRRYTDGNANGRCDLGECLT